MRTFILITITALIGAGIYWAANHDSVPVQNDSLRTAPGFALQSFDGKVHRLSDFKGETVVLHFWASWCPPCIEELPNWMALARDYQGKPVRWVAISLDPSWAEAHQTLPAKSVPAHVISVLDSDGVISDGYGSYQFPETYLVNREGKIVAKWVGPQDWTGKAMRAVIDSQIQ